MDTIRCPRCGSDPLYVTYHDSERWVPVHDDSKHFEFLLLECMQAGLSWITILRKRENYRIAFDGFDYHCIARYGDTKIEELMNNPGIIRNRAKINAAIHNAQVFLDIQSEYGSFDSYIWWWVSWKPVDTQLASPADYRATTPLSDAVSADLKRRGMKFVWSTTIYAHLQASGIVNDHLTSCWRYEEVKRLS